MEKVGGGHLHVLVHERGRQRRHSKQRRRVLCEQQCRENQKPKRSLKDLLRK